MFLTKGQNSDSFNLGDKVLKWDARYEDNGKHGKFTIYGKVLILFSHYVERIPTF